MSDVKEDPFEAAIDDLRALMTSFLEGDWTEMHVNDVRGGIFIAREGGGPNPLLGDIVAGGYVESESEPVGSASGVLRDLSAPHVATLVSIIAAGDHVAAGAELARLSVLDIEEPLLAPAAGEVVDVLVVAGALVEHGTVLIRLREANE